MTGDLKFARWKCGVTWASDAPFTDAPANVARSVVNFWPHASWLELRLGSKNRWALPAAGRMLLPVPSPGGTVLYAATDTGIYSIDTSSPDGTPPTAEVTGLTSGDWSHLETQTAGGHFFLCVNGADPMHVYDMSAWHNTATDPAYEVTGVNTRHLSHIWAFKQRIMAVESGTLNIWYSQPDAIVGQYTRFGLTSIFRFGGALLSGTTFSLDTGDGMDDRCVFFTTEGEIAIYEGNDPGSVSDWRLVGVFNAPPLLHKASFIHVAGDVLLITRDGILSLSSIVKSGGLAVQEGNLIAPIRSDWEDLLSIVQANARWSVTWTPDRRFILLAPSEDVDGSYTIVFNPVAKSLAKFTGWAHVDQGVVNGRLWGLDGDGNIAELNTGGSDNSDEYIASVCFGFSSLNMPTDKVLQFIEASFQSDATVVPTLAAGTDNDCYDGGDQSSISDVASAPPWDVTPWDTAYWGYVGLQTRKNMKAVGGIGRTVAPFFSVRCQQDNPVHLRLHDVGLWYREAAR